MEAHVFIDNSNIFGGAQRAAENHEPGVTSLAVRLYYKNFFTVIERGFDVKTRILAGSVPPGNEDLWKYAKLGGYNTDLLKKVTKDNGKLGEQGVDELLHLKIANVLLDFEPPQTLVLATGDGHDSDFETSFLKQVERALKKKWHVGIWSWKEQLSGKFEKLKGTHGQITIHHLNDFYECLVFLKPGTYQLPSGTGSVTLKGRYASKVPSLPPPCPPVNA
jgi:hypothetical protein